MKTKLILLASFALGTAAFAQETAPVAPPAAAAPAQPAMTTTDAATPAPTTTDTSATVADTTAPVAAPAQPSDTANYPVCSRGVTDKCVQAHERHRARPR